MWVHIYFEWVFSAGDDDSTIFKQDKSRPI